MLSPPQMQEMAQSCTTLVALVPMGKIAVQTSYKVTVTKQAGGDGDTGPPPTPRNREEAKALYLKRARPSAPDTSKAKPAPLFPAMYGDTDKTPLTCQVPPANGKVVLALPRSGK